MIERLARLGYVSIGAVYIIIGLLAATAALGRGGSTRGHEGAFAFIRHQPFGHFLLAVVALGLAGYAIWRLVAGIADTDTRGDDAKGLGIRAASIVRGLFYAVIAIEVVRMIAHRSGGDGGNDANAKHWTARLIDEPFGRWVIGAAGLAFIGGAVYQMYRAWESKLSKRLRLEHIDPPLRRKIVAVSRFGIGARAIVFFFIGGSLVLAAVQHEVGEAHGTSGALQQIAEPFGGALLVLVGIGLAAYGIYALVNARYRSIRA